MTCKHFGPPKVVAKQRAKGEKNAVGKGGGNAEERFVQHNKTNNEKEDVVAD